MIEENGQNMEVQQRGYMKNVDPREIAALGPGSPFIKARFEPTTATAKRSKGVMRYQTRLKLQESR